VVQDFLSSLLIEVVTENYRQLMFEQLMFSSGKIENEVLLDPPLRANERVMSGLFANAISRVAARSKPEVRIDRPSGSEEDGDADEESKEKNSDTTAGRVDFLAWYNSSTVALELKVAYVNWASPKITEIAHRRWKGVVGQANTAREALIKRQNEHRYPDPHSIGLMVLVSRSAAKVKEATGDKPASFSDVDVMNVAEMASKEFEPDFIATYTFPAEFRNFVRKRKGEENEDELRSTPFVTFIAYIAKGQ
jgi:hypothetical protein